MIWAISAFMDFCYLVRRSQINETVPKQIDDAVDHFHHECQIFIDLGIRDNFLLPCANTHLFITVLFYKYLVPQIVFTHLLLNQGCQAALLLFQPQQTSWPNAPQKPALRQAHSRTC
jgi:hypothetical protein